MKIRCFVMMPSGNHNEYDNIRHIAGWDVAIVDITGKIPSVFLELGMRYDLDQLSSPKPESACDEASD